jgi:hypothetical protein
LLVHFVLQRLSIDILGSFFMTTCDNVKQQCESKIQNAKIVVECPQYVIHVSIYFIYYSFHFLSLNTFSETDNYFL